MLFALTVQHKRFRRVRGVKERGRERERERERE